MQKEKNHSINVCSGEKLEQNNKKGRENGEKLRETNKEVSN